MDQISGVASVIAGGGSLAAALKVAKEWPRSGEQVAQEIVANYRADALEAVEGLSKLLGDMVMIKVDATDTQLAAVTAACQGTALRLLNYHQVKNAVNAARLAAV